MLILHTTRIALYYSKYDVMQHIRMTKTSSEYSTFSVSPITLTIPLPTQNKLKIDSLA